MDDRLKQYSSQFLTNRYGLMAFIGGLVRNPDVAEDIFQEVWIKLAEATEKGTAIQDPVRWCRQVAKNLILHYWREKHAGKLAGDTRLIDLAEQAFGEEDLTQERWTARRRALTECVKGLPEQSKQILALKYERGLTVVAIAERVQRSYDAVMMLLSRVRRVLTQCVEKKLQLSGELR